MTKKAETHYVYLKIDPKSRQVHKAPLPHGCKFDSEAACNTSQYASSGQRNTIKIPPGFIYLDVGVWAGQTYNFGLVCGRYVWLCTFTHEKIHQAISAEAYSGAPEPMKIFDSEMALTNKHGFNVDSYAKVPGAMKYIPDPNLLYIIIPDMHLTALPHNSEFAGKSYAEIADLRRDAARALNREYVPIVRREEIARYSAFRSAKDADIFGNAGKALYDFLNFVTDMAIGKMDRKLKIVHVGDMYELWQGMGEWNTYFDIDPNSKALIFEKDAIHHLSQRIAGIELQHRRLFLQFKYLELLKAITYLYGNHDVYLVDKMCAKNAAWRKALGDRLPRKTHLYENNMAFEHGHRVDSFNVDGEWKGPFITEMVYWFPTLRAFDPDRRDMYHLFSSIDVFYHNYFLRRPIAVFVMGHTHAADLKYIQFCRLQPGDIREKYSSCITCNEKKRKEYAHLPI